MTLRLNGSTSGYVEIDAPATAGSNTLVLPTGNGTANQALVTDGSGTLSFADRGRIVQGTAQASTSGTSIDFTGIPSWVKRITVMFSGISTNGTSPYIIQLGDSGGVEVTNYLGSATRTVNASSPDVSGFTSSFILTQTIAAASSYAGTATLTLHNASTNLWNFVSTGGLTANAVGFFSSGEKALSATLDRIRITTVSGTDTFDAGSINIMYEG